MEYSYNENKLTLIGFLVTVCVVVFLLAIAHCFLICTYPPVRLIAERTVCGTNLKWLGTAMTTYANDYDGRFPQLPSEGPWSKELGFDYDLKDPDFKGEYSKTGRTISASLYLLVREADMSPKSFVCLSSKEKAFDGVSLRNPGLDIVQMWDFGDNPYKHVSYVMQNPYGKYPANDKLGANFAVAADMNPWMTMGDFVSRPNKNNHPQIIIVDEETTYLYGNSFNHPQIAQEGIRRNRYIKGTAEGQNVLFGDGHISHSQTFQRRTSFEYKNRPNCGMNNDNIYTRWSTDKNPTEQDIQGGIAPTGRDTENDAQSREDSFLVL